ncbi:hypothetical protein E4H12_13480 [Candidatus Thorarchaeota archaeon]|nr:MAG: hypothetical protein E4H12_13480 [Candidatus Thorarchaeota archaeon]
MKTKQDVIKKWFDSGVEVDASYMLVVRSNEGEKPVYVMRYESKAMIEQLYNDGRHIEAQYDLREPFKKAKLK